MRSFNCSDVQLYNGANADIPERIVQRILRLSEILHDRPHLILKEDFVLVNYLLLTRRLKSSVKQTI